MKFFLLLFAYSILLVHNCVPHYHHYFEDITDEHHHEVIDEHHHHEVTDKNTTTAHHHSHNENQNNTSESDDKDDANEHSHFFHALDLSDFLSNEKNISAEKKYSPNQDLFAESNLVADYFYKPPSLRIDLIENVNFDPHCISLCLKAPPVC